MNKIGHHDYRSLGSKDRPLQNNSRILIVTSAQFAGGLSRPVIESGLPGMNVLEAESTAPIPEASLEGIGLLILEVDPADRRSMQRLGDIRKRHPKLPVIAAIENSSVDLVRTLIHLGVADVVTLPFDDSELLQTALNVLASHRAAEIAEAGLAPVIAVACARGGAGATSIATHLAAELGRIDQTGKGVVIVDLDMQFGSVSDYLGGKGRGTVSDLLEAEDRLDEDLVRSITRQIGGNVSIVAAPDEIKPLEMVDTDQLLRILKQLQRQFGYVILDLPANWTNWTLSATLASDVVLLVVELSVSSLHQGRRRLELFKSIGMDPGDIEIVVNRVRRSLFRVIDLDDVSTTLNHQVLSSIAFEDSTVSAFQDRGQLVSSGSRRSHFVKDIERLAGLLSAKLATGSR